MSPVEPNPVDPDALYPPTADLVAASSNAALLGLTPEQQDALRVAAIGALEDYCGQSFSPEVAVYAIDGQGGNRIALPRRLDSLDAIDVVGTALGIDDVSLGPDGATLTIKAIDEVGNYYTRTLADMDPMPREFKAGVGSVIVTGTWGWSTMPPEVATALRYDMEDTATADVNALSPTISAYRMMGLRGLQQGRLSAQLGPLSTSGLSLRAQRAVPRRLVWTSRAGAWA